MTLQSFFSLGATRRSVLHVLAMPASVLVAALLFTVPTKAAGFGTRGGPEPANIEAISAELRQDAYDMELLISYGTSKGGSAGHLALAIRDQVPGDDVV